MTTEDTGRPQDQGRSHRAKGRPSAETSELLTRYQRVMREDLAALLDELEPSEPAPGLLPDGSGVKVRKPAKDRAQLWDLAVKLARELGTAIDPTPAETEAGAPGVPRRPRRGRVDFGGA